MLLFLVLFSSMVLGDFSAYSDYSKFELCKGEIFTDTIFIENNNPEQIVVEISQENEALSPFTTIVPDELVVEPYGEAEISHIIWARKDAGREYESNLLFETQGTKKRLSQEIEFLVCDNFEIESEMTGFSNCPCIPTTYSFELKNTGSFEDTFDLSMDLNESFYNLSEDSITLEPGMEKSFYADVIKPCELSGNFSMNLAAESKASGLKKTESLFLNLRDDCYNFEFYFGNVTKDLTKDFVVKKNRTYELEMNETVYVPFSIRNTGEFNNSYDVTAKKPEFMELYWDNKTQAINETGYGYIKANTTSVDEPNFDVLINVSSNVGYHEAQYNFDGIVKGVEKPWEGFLNNLYRYLAYLGILIIILLLVTGFIVYLILKRKEASSANEKDLKGDNKHKEPIEEKETLGSEVEDKNFFVNEVSGTDEAETSVAQEKKSKTEKRLPKEKTSNGLSGGFIVLIIAIIVLAFVLLGLAIFLFWPSVYQDDLTDTLYNETFDEKFENTTTNETGVVGDAIGNITVDINKTSEEPYLVPSDDVNVTEIENKTTISKISDTLIGSGNFVLKNYLFFIIGLVVLLLLIIGFVYRQKIKTFFTAFANQKKTIGIMLIIAGFLMLFILIFFYGSFGGISFVQESDDEPTYYGTLENPGLEELQAIHPDLTEENVTHYIWRKNENKTIDVGQGQDFESWENISYYPADIQNITVEVNGTKLTFQPDKSWEGNRIVDIIARDVDGRVVYNSAFVLVVLDGESTVQDSFFKQFFGFFSIYYVHLITFFVILILLVVGLIIYSNKRASKKIAGTKKIAKEEEKKKVTKRNGKKSKKNVKKQSKLNGTKNPSKKKSNIKSASSSSSVSGTKKESSEPKNAQEDSKNDKTSKEESPAEDRKNK